MPILFHHSSRVIPMLSLGLSLSSKHVGPDELDEFMRRMLISRISRRVLVEHHIALSASHQRGTSLSPKNQVGIIVTDLSVRESIARCQKILREAHETESTTSPFPTIEIDGHVDTRFSYIKVSDKFSCHVWNSQSDVLKLRRNTSIM